MYAHPRRGVRRYPGFLLWGVAARDAYACARRLAAHFAVALHHVAAQVLRAKGLHENLPGAGRHANAGEQWKERRRVFRSLLCLQPAGRPGYPRTPRSRTRYSSQPCTQEAGSRRQTSRSRTASPTRRSWRCCCNGSDRGAFKGAPSRCAAPGAAAAERAVAAATPPAATHQAIRRSGARHCQCRRILRQLYPSEKAATQTSPVAGRPSPGEKRLARRRRLEQAVLVVLRS